MMVLAELAAAAYQKITAVVSAICLLLMMMEVLPLLVVITPALN